MPAWGRTYWPGQLEILIATGTRSSRLGSDTVSPVRGLTFSGHGVGMGVRVGVGVRVRVGVGVEVGGGVAVGAGVRVGVGGVSVVSPLQPPSAPERSATAANPVIRAKARSRFLCSVWPILVYLRSPSYVLRPTFYVLCPASYVRGFCSAAYYSTRGRTGNRSRNGVEQRMGRIEGASPW